MSRLNKHFGEKTGKRTHQILVELQGVVTGMFASTQHEAFGKLDQSCIEEARTLLVGGTAEEFARVLIHQLRLNADKLERQMIELQAKGRP